MFLSKLRTGALVVLCAVALAAGGLVAGRTLLAAGPPAAAGANDAPPARAAEGGKKDGKGPVVVQVVKPQPDAAERTTQQPCSAQAFSQADLVPQVSGVVKEVAVDIGDRVKKGQVLAVIDAPLLALEARQATAAVQQAKAAIEEAEARVAAARAQLDAAASVVQQREAEVKSAQAAVSYRRQQLKRIQDLSKQGSVPAQLVMEKEGEVEAAEAAVGAATAALRNAKSDREVQRSRVTQAQAAVATARANLESAQAGLEKARYTLDLATIRSPFDGVVTRRNFFPGDYVRPEERERQSPLLTVARTDRVRVVVGVPDADVPYTEPGSPVDLTFDALPGEKFTGYKVSRTAFVEDLPRAMTVEIDVPNPKEILRPGMFGQATIHLGKAPPRALRVPASCLIRNPGHQAAVYVVRDGKAYLTPVQLYGALSDVAYVSSGLRPDDQVVADPKGLTGDVVPVEVKEKGAPK